MMIMIMTMRSIGWLVSWLVSWLDVILMNLMNSFFFVLARSLVRGLSYLHKVPYFMYGEAIGDRGREIYHQTIQFHFRDRKSVV